MTSSSISIRKKSDFEISIQNSENIIETIKEDGDKTIRKVFDQVSSRVCVRKIFHNISAEGLNIYLRIRQLQRALPLLRLHTAEIYDVILLDNGNGTYDGTVLESFVEGKTIAEELDYPGNRMFEDVAINYIIQICDGLNELHQQQPPIVHRDIKPANLVISNDNVCKIIDFDISREVKNVSVKDTVYGGTPGYIAPEQVTGEHQSVPQTDVMGLGITLHEILVGTLQHEKVLNNQSLYYSRKRIRLNRKLKNIIIKCVNPNIERRFKNAGELRNALTKYMAKKRNSRRKVILIISVLVLFWVVLAIISVFGNSNESATEGKEAERVTQESFEEIVASEEKEEFQEDAIGTGKGENETIIHYVEESKELLPSDAEQGVSVLQKEKYENSTMSQESQSETVAELDESSDKHGDPEYDLPLTGHFVVRESVSDICALTTDAEGKYYYIDNSAKQIVSSAGETIDISGYNTNNCGLSFNYINSEVYFISGDMEIYLVGSDTLQKLMDSKPELLNHDYGKWSCMYFPDGTMYCGKCGWLIDTTSWKTLYAMYDYDRCYTINGRVFKRYDFGVHEIDALGNYIDSYSGLTVDSTTSMFSDGKYIYTLDLYQGRSFVFDGYQWEEYATFQHSNFGSAYSYSVSKTNGGFIFYQANRIIELILE